MIVSVLNLHIISEEPNMVIRAGAITKNRTSCDSHLHAEWHCPWLFWEAFCL